MSGREVQAVLDAIPSSDQCQDDPILWDIIIVGAGVAGSALAFAQGQAGRRVLVVERDLSEPDRIVGELLQPGGYLMLKRLGLSGAIDGIDSIKVQGYAIFKGGQRITLKYPTEGFSEDVAGRSFHHGRFVQRLRQEASKQESVTMRQGTVRKLLNDKDEDWEEGQVVSGVQYKGKDGQLRIAHAHLTLVCDGMYSSLRSKLSKPDIKHPGYFVGLILQNAQLPCPRHGHVVLTTKSPILFYPISSTEVRCLVDVPGNKLPSNATGELQQYLREVIAPEVPEELREPFLHAVEHAHIRSMQNKQMPAKPLHQPGALLLGDAFNMRHPLTGGGMTVALSDCNLLCDMLQPLPDMTDPIATANRTAEFYTKRKPLSATINTLANALYQVFCASGTDAQEQMRQACFDYLSLGGIHAEGPISLLSGLNPRPSVLVAHFFMVALYGTYRLMWPRPTFKGLYLTLALLYVASSIIFPIILAEGPVAVFFPMLAPKPYVWRQGPFSYLPKVGQMDTSQKRL